MAAYDYVLFTGQSLARGNATDGTFDLAGAQANPTYIKQISTAGVLSPCEAPDAIYAYGGIIPSRSFADAAWKGTGNYLAVNTHAEGGQAYSALKKGTATYNAAVDAITDAVTVNTGDTFTARALHVIHGEADYSAGTTQAQYLANLAEWLTDYNADIKAATGQATDMVMFVCQPSTYGLNNITQAQIQAHRENARTYLVCPKYQFSTALHLESQDYFRLGEYHARAYAAVVNNGGTWSPLMPLTATATRKTVTVTFHVPTPPIVFDTSLVAAVANKGFVVSDDAGTKTISDVSISGTDKVVITLTTELGVNPRVKYATGALGGNLRDSDPSVSTLDGAALPNWCVHFNDPITVNPQWPDLKTRPPKMLLY